jgi:excisionase family DNA binding protein
MRNLDKHFEIASAKLRRRIASPLDERLAYGVQDAAKLLSMGERTLWELIASGELHSIKRGGRRLVPRTALLDFIEE